jgi:hypothetical protein
MGKGWRLQFQLKRKQVDWEMAKDISVVLPPNGSAFYRVLTK